MFVLNVFLFSIVSSSAFGSVAKQRPSSCGVGEFSCSDGACVALSGVCDGRRDCLDGADEAVCFTGASQGGLLEDTVLHRSKRQSSQCRRDQWQCRDGTCISFDGKCDGVVDCPDKSDETFPLCRKTRCQPNWFRCTYGACVDGTAPCNGIMECADNSDELRPACRNETDEALGQFRCLDGSSIPASDHCDGTPNCLDGSDETIRACAAKTCPSYLFQCAYGACVDQGADCNGQRDCADGSDESDELCDKMLTPVQGTTSPVSSTTCVLPPYPDHGSYTVSGAPLARPGQTFRALQLTVSCRPGYGVSHDKLVFCQEGTWSTQPFPTCIRLCKLDPNPSVHYHCKVSGSIQGQRACGLYEPAGTVVIPECNSPNYYSAVTLSAMRCIDGSWDYVAVCTPGLPKKGLNITIIIKDKVEVYINEFPYGSNGKTSDNITINYNTEAGFGKINTTLSETTVNPLDYDISEDDWRMGPVSPPKPVTTADNHTNNDAGVNVHIYNSSVVVNSNDKIHFLD